MTGLFRRLRQLAAVARHLRFEAFPLRASPLECITTDQADASAVRWLGPVSLAGDAREALFCHARSSVSFSLQAWPGDVVAASCGLLPDVWDKNAGGVLFTISVIAAGGSPRRRSIVVDPHGRAGDRAWRSITVPVPVAAPEVVTITFETAPPPGSTTAYAWAVWGEPVLRRRRAGVTPLSLARDVTRRLIREGPGSALRALYADACVDAVRDRYQTWWQQRAPGALRLAEAAAEVARLPRQPRISILTPAFNTPADLLRACVASVLAQTYPHWEWCLCNDASTSPDTLAVLQSVTDPRIRVITLEKNAGIALATQAALDAATGEFVALLDSDDELTPDALGAMVHRLNDTPQPDVIYSDEDKRDEDGRLSEPYFKPDWSPDHLLSAMYPCHFLLARRSLVQEAGGFRKRCDGSQDHDLMLRLVERTERIDHLPQVLYHWRRAPMSGATKAGSKPWADDAGRIAVADALERRGLAGEVVSGGVPGLYRPVFEIRDQPRTLVLVLGDDREAADACAARIRQVTTSAAFDICATLAVCVDINALVADTLATHIAFVDAALDVGDEGWLAGLLEFSQLPDIGAVGGKVHYADGRLRHIGLLVGVGRGVARAMHQHPSNSYGYFSSAIGIRNYSAVSGEFFMTRRALIEEAGGFDASLPWVGADVDYGLKQQARGRRVVFTPHPLARIRAGATPLASEPLPETIAQLQTRWPEAFARDPFYNVNLSPASGDYLLG